MTIYGFDDYKTLHINHTFFEPGARTSFTGWQRPDSPYFYKPLTDEEHAALFGRHSIRVSDLPSLDGKFHIPNGGESLYFAPGCKIPRTLCETKWKRVVKITKADVVVIPEAKSLAMYDNLALFRSDADKCFLMLMLYDFGVWKKIIPPDIGDTLEMLLATNRHLISNESMSRECNQPYLKAASHYECVYKGPILKWDRKDNFLTDIFDGMYRKVVLENDLVKELGNSENAFTEENITSIMEMLLSRDADSVHHGMRILASMDYANHPSIVYYILGQTSYSWERHKPFNSAVQFMFKNLKYTSWSGREPFHNVNNEEFGFCRKRFITDAIKNIQERIRNLRQQTNMVLRFDYSIDVLPPGTEINEQFNNDMTQCVS